MKNIFNKRYKSPLRVLVLLSVTLVFVTAGLLFATRDTSRGYPLPPEGRAYFGVQLDTGNDSLSSYSGRLGSTPAVVGEYVNFPMTKADIDNTNAQVVRLADEHSSLMITLEPRENLSVVTRANLDKLSKDLTKWNNQGTPILVRFAHEMNGSWYPWAQSPEEYVSAFRRTSLAVHKAPHSSILWSPNEGGGYPFAGGPFEAKPGSKDFNKLDTNSDGKLTAADDPYSPYWPGEDYVDWVGLSVYHFGTQYPWGENEVPDKGKLEAKITGNYHSDLVDERDVPDFYEIYAADMKKPFAISETSALYNKSRADGATEEQIKTAWLNQLFNPTFTNRYRQLKLAMWFEYKKSERDTQQDIIDWRATSSPSVRSEIRSHFPGFYITNPVK